MSTSLMWKPATQAEGDLPDELKRVLSRKLWDTDGSCGAGNRTLSYEDISHLEGLKDDGVNGAAELIELIYKHNEIILWHEG